MVLFDIAITDIISCAYKYVADKYDLTLTLIYI